MTDVATSMIWGVDLGDDVEELENAVTSHCGEDFLENHNLEEGFNKLLLKELGLKPIDEDLNRHLPTFYKSQQKQNEQIANYGLKLTQYGGSDEHAYILGVKDKYLTSEHGICKMSEAMLDVPNELKVKLLHFCSKYGITITEPPVWRIYNYEYS